MPTPLPCQRHLFEIPRDVAYFNTAWVAPSTIAARQAGERGVRTKSEPWRMDSDMFFDPPEVVRGLFATLIGASAKDVAFAPSTSYGLAIAARALPLAGGQRIVVLQNQYPNNVFPWREAARRTGAEIVTVAPPVESDWSAAILDAIDERTAIVALPNAHWMNGYALDLVRIGTRCRAAGAALVVDATQSLGALPFDVREVKPDFMVSAGYKWLFCPYSFCFLYAAPHRQTAEPLEMHWSTRAGAREGHDWKDGILQYRDGWLEGAHRYDVGERANFALVPMAEAGLRQLLQWTPEAVLATLRPIVDGICAVAADLGYAMPAAANRAGHFVGLDWPRSFSPDTHTILRRHGVFLTVRDRTLRIAPHVWVDGSDVSRLESALAELARA